MIMIILYFIRILYSHRKLKQNAYYYLIKTSIGTYNLNFILYKFQKKKKCSYILLIIIGLMAFILI
jgi:hypothetical protein